MIHWLIQSTAAHPGLARGQAPPGLLSAKESTVLGGYKVRKRRQDWLLGRWTTKLLLHEIIHQDSGRTVPLDSISILAGKDGAPRASFDAPYSDLDSLFSVSISHSHGTSLCAAVTRPEYPLGADIELIEPRSDKFAADFFTEEEQSQVRDVAPAMKDTLVTAVWSGKEAVVKAIHEGLRSDTRSVNCNFAGLTEPGSLHSKVEEGSGRDAGPPKWRPFRIRWEREADIGQRPALKGWWMVSSRYVLTLAAEDDKSTRDFEIGAYPGTYPTNQNDQLLASE